MYLAWLASAQAEELEDDEVEPPVPPGLRTFSASLTSLVDFLRIDQDLLAIAAAASAPLEAQELSEAELTRWVEGLAEREKNALILRVAQADGVNLQAELLRRVRGISAPVAGHRTISELLDGGHIRRVEREQRAAELPRSAPTASARPRWHARKGWNRWRSGRNRPGNACTR